MDQQMTGRTGPGVPAGAASNVCTSTRTDTSWHLPGAQLDRWPHAGPTGVLPALPTATPGLSRGVCSTGRRQVAPPASVTPGVTWKGRREAPCGPNAVQRVPCLSQAPEWGTCPPVPGEPGPGLLCASWSEGTGTWGSRPSYPARYLAAWKWDCQAVVTRPLCGPEMQSTLPWVGDTGEAAGRGVRVQPRV